MKLRPLGNRLVVEPITEEEVTKSGIVLPDTVDKEKKGRRQSHRHRRGREDRQI